VHLQQLLSVSLVYARVMLDLLAFFPFLALVGLEAFEAGRFAGPGICLAYAPYVLIILTMGRRRRSVVLLRRRSAAALHMVSIYWAPIEH
jgi:hypothetical protein